MTWLSLLCIFSWIWGKAVKRTEIFYTLLRLLLKLVISWDSPFLAFLYISKYFRLKWKGEELKLLNSRHTDPTRTVYSSHLCYLTFSEGTDDMKIKRFSPVPTEEQGSLRGTVRKPKLTGITGKVGTHYKKHRGWCCSSPTETQRRLLYACVVRWFETRVLTSFCWHVQDWSIRCSVLTQKISVSQTTPPCFSSCRGGSRARPQGSLWDCCLLWSSLSYFS